MDDSVRKAEREVRAARGAYDAAGFAAARERLRVVRARAGGRDPRIDPRDGDVVRGGARAAGRPRVVDEVFTEPGWYETRHVDRLELMRALEAAGLVARPARVPGLHFEHTSGRGVHVYEEQGQHYGLGVSHAVELLAELRATTRAVIAAELGVVGPWVDWRAVVDLDRMAQVSTARARADGARTWEAAGHKRRARGRCTLKAWRAWANGGEVLRFAEECG